VSVPTDQQIETIRSHRHRLRLAGEWGACYETSCFIEHHFHWRRRDGVYQLHDGTPVILHSWNEADDGTIIDGTADQFFEGHDVAVFGAGDPGRQNYRARYTPTHNPAVTAWLANCPYIGSTDGEYWNGRDQARMLGPGWWLADNRDYLRWLLDGAARYWFFSAKVAEYRDLGYAGLSVEP
jgi:hypothetical protein